MMVINGLACHEMQIRQIIILKSNSCINFAQVGPTLDQDVMISVGYNKHLFLLKTPSLNTGRGRQYYYTMMIKNISKIEHLNKFLYDE